MKQKGLLSIVLSVFFVFGLSAVEEWKPAEEPRTKQEASEMRVEAERREKEAEQARQEAERQGEQERARQEELNVERARYDVNTAKIGEAKSELATPGADREQMQREIEQAQLDRQAVETRIEALSKEVGVAYESPTPVEDPAKWNDYYEGIQKQIEAAPGQELRVLKRSFFSAKKEFANYAEQRNALEQLHDLVTDQQGEAADAFAEQLQNRIAEIDAFLKDPPQALPQNAVASRLKLSEMIPSDQALAVKKELPSIKDNITDLELMLGAMKRYGIDRAEPKFTRTIEDRISELAPKKEEPKSQETQALEGYYERVIAGAADVAAALVPAAVKENWAGFREGVDDMFERVPRYLDAQGAQLEGYANTMVRAPQMAEMALSAAEQVGVNLAKVERVAQYIPGQNGDKIIGYIKTGKWAVGKTKESEAAIRSAASLSENIGKVVAKAGQTVRSVAEGTKWVGEQIKAQEEVITQDQPEEALKVVGDIERAQVAIEEERYNIFSEEKIQTLKDKFFKPIVDFGKKIGTWFKDMFRKNNFKERLVTAKQNYTSARVEYLKTIGFTDEEIGLDATTGAIKLTPDQIETKLQATQKDEAKQEQLKQANAQFAQRSSELAQIYKDFADQLESVRTNYEFLVNGWDSLALPKQEEISGLVNMIFDARDMKVAYLDALRSSLDVLAADINEEVQGTDFQNITDDVLGSIRDSLSGATVDTITKFEDQIGVMDEQLSATRKTVENYLRAMQPSIPG